LQQNFLHDDMIEQDLLFACGGNCRKYEKNQPIFFEGNKAIFYYQVMEGSVRMANTNEDGKEFIQGIFKSGESFGEPVLFIDESYPATAIANETSLIVRITKDQFFYLLKEYPEVHLKITQTLARRIFNKSIVSKEIAVENPEHRIITVLQLLKHRSGCNDEKRFRIELSRQQIADMTGLRTETVIRTMRKLKDKGAIEIEKGKVFV
jgi:CRP-like cAMP-binding protein